MFSGFQHRIPDIFSHLDTSVSTDNEKRLKMQSSPTDFEHVSPNIFSPLNISALTDNEISFDINYEFMQPQLCSTPVQLGDYEVDVNCETPKTEVLVSTDSDQLDFMLFDGANTTENQFVRNLDNIFERHKVTDIARKEIKKLIADTLPVSTTLRDQHLSPLKPLVTKKLL